MDTLKKTAFGRRLMVLDMVYNSKAGHIGGSMSCMEIMTVLYDAVMDADKIKAQAADRDRFILSKGHCAEALYAVLADKGFFDRAELETFTRFQSRLAEHPTSKIPGIEIATGALGHGVCIGVGMAIGLKRSGNSAHVYVLMGDGEQAEGTVWEAAMAAAKYELDNLTCIIDRNQLQISGGTEDVMPLNDLARKYEAFGFSVTACDGHDTQALKTALRKRKSNVPTVVIANTAKGYGSAVMQDKAEWHHAIPNVEQYEQIKRDFQTTAEEA